VPPHPNPPPPPPPPPPRNPPPPPPPCAAISAYVYGHCRGSEADQGRTSGEALVCISDHTRAYLGPYTGVSRTIRERISDHTRAYLGPYASVSPTIRERISDHTRAYLCYLGPYASVSRTIRAHSLMLSEGLGTYLSMRAQTHAQIARVCFAQGEHACLYAAAIRRLRDSGYVAPYMA
jgi:hypothetical protein